MQRLELSGAVRPIYGSLGVKRLKYKKGDSTYTNLKRIQYAEDIQGSPPPQVQRQCILIKAEQFGAKRKFAHSAITLA